MINKMLLLPLMVLTALSVVPNNEVKNANAEETIKVEEGYITKNLVDSKDKVVYMNNNTIKENFESNFSELPVQEMYYDDSIMRAVFGDESKTLSDGSSFRDSYVVAEKNNTQISGSGCIVHTGKKVNVQTKNYYSYTKFGVDYRFTGIDYTKPLELVFPVAFPSYEKLISEYGKTDYTFPIVTINGVDYLTMNYSKESNSFTYETYNSRVYFGYDKDSSSEEVVRNGYVFLEIPYTQTLQTIRLLHYRFFSHNGGLSDTNKFYVLKSTMDTGFKCPIILDNLNFKNGTVSAITSNSVYLDDDNNATVNADTCKYYQLTSITFNNGLKLYTKPQNKYLTGREEDYDLYLNKNYETRFTYDCTDSFAKELSSAKENVDFNVTRYDYIVKESSTVEESGYATTEDFVNCGTYYAFKKISTEQIHVVTFDGLQSKKGLYCRLAFNVFDDTSKINIRKLNALWFRYTYKGNKYSLCINANDINKSVHAGESADDFRFSFLYGYLYINYISKKDKNGIEFKLTGLKNSDYWLFDNFKNDETLKKANRKDMFLLYTGNKSVDFTSLVSAVYFDEEGTIINGSANLPDGTEAPTAIIGKDGKVSVIDKNGNTVAGTVKDGIFYDEYGNERPENNNIDYLKTWWDNFLSSFDNTVQKIISIILLIAIILGVLYLISKIGPTLAIVFTNRSKNKKKKRRK